MQKIIAMALLIGCATFTQAQDIPRRVLLLNNGGFVHGIVLDSAQGIASVQLYMGDVIQLHSSAINREITLSEQQREEIRERLVSPELAVALSLLVNGGGQLYVGNYTEGVLHIALQAAMVTWMAVGIHSGDKGYTAFGTIILVALKSLSIADAGSTAMAINRMRINRAIIEGIASEGRPPYEMSFGVQPILDGASVGMQVRF